LTILFSPKDAQLFQANLLVTSNASNGAVRTVALSGLGYEKHGQINVNISELDFGKVKFKENKDTTFDVNNTGDTTLLITNMQIDNSADSAFSVIGFSGQDSIPSLGTKKYTMRFSPKSVKSYSKPLTISSNSRIFKDITINLIGEGVINNHVGDDRKSEGSIQITPNPAHDSFKLCSNGMIRKIEIYNLNGIKILEIENSEIIDLKNFNAGIYYIKTGNNILPLIKY